LTRKVGEKNGNPESVAEAMKQQFCWFFLLPKQKQPTNQKQKTGETPPNKKTKIFFLFTPPPKTTHDPEARPPSHQSSSLKGAFKLGEASTAWFNDPSKRHREGRGHHF